MAKKLKVMDVVKKEKIDPISLIREFNTIKKEKSELEKREAKIKTELDKYMDNTLQADSRGHRYYEATDDFGEKIILKREARKSMSINMDKLKATFPKNILKEIIKKETVTTEVIQEDVIEQMIASEEITMDELEKVTDIKLTYATKFVKQVEVDEVEGE